MVFGWAPEATIGARISSPSASVTPTIRPSRTSIGRDLGVGADRRRPAASAERAIAWLIAPIPPITWPQTPGDAVELAERVVQEVVGGAGRARARPDADHAARGDRALDRVVLEPVVEQVADRHREDPDQVVDVAPGEPGGAARPRAASAAMSSGLREPSAGGSRSIIGRRNSRGSLEQVLEVRVDLAVLLRDASRSRRRSARAR